MGYVSPYKVRRSTFVDVDNGTPYRFYLDRRAVTLRVLGLINRLSISDLKLKISGIKSLVRKYISAVTM